MFIDCKCECFEDSALREECLNGSGNETTCVQVAAGSDCSWQPIGKHLPEPRADLKTCLSAVHVTGTAVVKIVRV